MITFAEAENEGDGGTRGMRHLPPIAEAVDAALREAIRARDMSLCSGSGFPDERQLRRIVEIACEAISEHNPRVLADAARVRTGYALRDRDAKLRRLRLPAKTLAARFGLSERQVHRVLAERRKT